MELKEMMKVYSAFGQYVVKQGRTNLSKKSKSPNNYTGGLYQSLKYSVAENNGDLSLKILMDNYGMFQDAGVYGANPKLVKGGKQKGKSTNTIFGRFSYTSKMPPMKPLMNWAKFNNIRFRDKKGKYMKGNYKTIGFWLQKRIFAQGIKPTLWFTKPFRKAFENLPADLSKAFAADLALNLKQK